MSYRHMGYIPFYYINCTFEYNSLKFNIFNNYVRSTQILLGVVTHTNQYGTFVYGEQKYEIYYAK